MKKRLTKRMLCILLAGVMLLPVSVLADTESEVQNRISESKKAITKSQNETANIEADIENKKEEIAQLYAQTQVFEIQKQEYIEDMKTRIVYMYENEYDFLEVFAKSGSSADFVSRYQYVKALHDYDSQKLTEFQNLLEVIKKNQETLNSSIDELEVLLTQQEEITSQLESQLASDEKKLKEIQEEKARLAELRRQQEAARQAEIARRQAAEAAAAKKKQQEAAASEQKKQQTAPTVKEEPKKQETTESNPVVDYVASSNGGQLTKEKGVVYYNGHRETWYSQRVLPGNGLNIPGRHVASDGTVRDGDGFICVASSDHPRGTIVETSLGTGKVYDCGCASGTIDVYVDW